MKCREILINFINIDFFWNMSGDVLLKFLGLRGAEVCKYCRCSIMLNRSAQFLAIEFAHMALNELLKVWMLFHSFFHAGV